MEQLKQEILNCQACSLVTNRYNPVIGSGNENADIVFCGEAPGRNEDEQGLPFVGKSGEKLTQIINLLGYHRQDVYILNVIKCRPTGNRNPTTKEIKICLPFLKKQLKLISPKFLILLGAIPFKALLGEQGLMKKHGQWYKYNNIPTMPLYHPAFLLRSPDRCKDTWEDIQELQKYL